MSQDLATLLKRSIAEVQLAKRMWPGAHLGAMENAMPRHDKARKKAALDALMAAWTEDQTTEKQLADLAARRDVLAARIEALKAELLENPPAPVAAPVPEPKHTAAVGRPRKEPSPAPTGAGLYERVSTIVRGFDGVFGPEDVAAAAHIQVNQARGCIATLMRLREVRRVGIGQYELATAAPASPPIPNSTDLAS